MCTSRPCCPTAAAAAGGGAAGYTQLIVSIRTPRRFELCTVTASRPGALHPYDSGNCCFISITLTVAAPMARLATVQQAQQRARPRRRVAAQLASSLLLPLAALP